MVPRDEDERRAALAGGSPGEFNPGSGPGRPPACRQLVAGGALAVESPPSFGAAGGTIGGVSLKQRTRATQKTESPRRGPGGRARRRARGTVRGGGPGWDGVHDGHRRDRGKGSPGEGEPSRGALASPSARRTRHPTRGRGARRTSATGGCRRAGPWARGEREAGDRSRGGRGSRGVALPAWGAGARRGLAGVGLGREGRRHNQGSATLPGQMEDFPGGSRRCRPAGAPFRGLPPRQR